MFVSPQPWESEDVAGGDSKSRPRGREWACGRNSMLGKIATFRPGEERRSGRRPTTLGSAGTWRLGGLRRPIDAALRLVNDGVNGNRKQSGSGSGSCCAHGRAVLSQEAIRTVLCKE